MKPSCILILSLLLSTAIVAPSVVTLVTMDKDTAFHVDFNDEENKKEEKKEVNEKDFFLYTSTFGITATENLRSNFMSTYVAPYYTNTLEIFLPPPKSVG